MKADTKELAVVKQQLTKATQAANELVIKDEASFAFAADLLTKIKKVGKLITEKKTGFTKPAYDAYKAISEKAKELFDPLIEAYSDAEQLVKSKALQYRAEVNRLAEIEQKRIAAEAAKKILENPDSQQKVMTSAAKKMEKVETVGSSVSGNKGGAMNFKKVRVVEIKDESVLPRAYLVANVKLIEKDALAGVQIPGVEVREEERVAGTFA